ncbi:hypothetical protein FQN50_002874 [Emmonsiellopsis sp. PD_5]|nr:hypothetical protein FQN50_002874 [Emmonsiellopsis sp. PD_5]
MTSTPPSHAEPFNLDAVGYRDVSTLLIPLSECAVLTSKLPSNKKKSVSIPSSALDKLHDHLGSASKPISPEIYALKLGQCKDIALYSLGSRAESYFVIQSTKEDECYVNSLHCQLIRDPDRDAVIIYNASTSIFKLHTLGNAPSVLKILPTNSETLDCGNWYLELGKGLEFLLRILPCDPEIYMKLLPPCKPESAAPPRAKEPSVDKQSRDESPLSDLPLIIGETNLTRVLRTQQNGKIVAAKICRKSDIKNAADLWDNERKILSVLKHHSIVQLLDFDGPRLTIYLEYIEGTDLSKLVDADLNSQIARPDQFKIWKDISSALQYIHNLGIIHHDIKPHNIILGNGNRGAVLCDFGLATSSSLRIQKGGTPCYIPPEFLYGERAEPSDIWAFGVTMLFVYGLLPLPSGTWRIARMEEDTHTLIRMVEWLGQVRRARTRVPRRLALLRSMLAEDAADRLTASDLVRDLAGMIADNEERDEGLLLTTG